MRTVLNYWQFIEREAARAKADGCTGVSEWHRECCLEHDLACRYGRNPRSAYALYCGHHEHFWLLAEPITRYQADVAFGECNWEWSPTRAGKIRSVVRYIGVRVGALLGIGTRKPRV